MRPDRTDAAHVRARPGPGHGADRGSASIWVLAVAALLFVVAGVAVLRGTATLARHRAETAADAAALAAAGQIGVSDDPCHRAAQIAAANRADLRNCRLNLTEDGRSGQVRVTVEFSISLPMVGLNTVLARARAERAPP